ncbi:MAG: WD40 repeat domain-containing protein [Planctomycetes bacterium]|nr:WD40 repeat domain-containing protein [Planctomycetota bacterium]
MQKLSCPRGGAARLTFSADGDLLAGLGPTASPPALGAAPTAWYLWTRSRDWEITGLQPKAQLTGLAFHPTGRTLAYARLIPETAVPPPPSPPAGTPPPSVWRRRFAKETPRPFAGVHLYPLTGIDEFAPSRLRVPLEVGTIARPDHWARGLAFTPDGRWLLAGHVEHPGFNFTRVNVLHWHFTETDGVWLVADPVAASGETVNGGGLVGGYLALAGVWGVAACPVESTTGLFLPDVRAAAAVAVAPRGELVAACERGRPVSVWHLRSAAPIATAADGDAGALAFSPDGATLAVGRTTGAVGFWDVRTGAAGPVRDFGVGPITSLAYAPDGLTLAVAGRTGVVVVDTD